MATEIEVKFSRMANLRINDSSCTSHKSSGEPPQKNYQYIPTVVIIGTNQAVCFHSCQLNSGHDGHLQIILYDDASEPQQKSQEADSLAPMKHRPAKDGGI